MKIITAFFCGLFSVGLLVAGTFEPQSVPVFYHSRHIPLEHLKFNQYAKATNTKSLTEVLEPEKLSDLKRWGIDTIELRFAWWALEQQKGVFDWSRLDRDMAKVESGGLKSGLMAWFFYPPPWYDGPRFHCIPHDVDAATLSPWSPETLAVADRVYGLIAQRYGKRIDFVYTMGSGDYGEPTLPHGVTHYKFASEHTHSGIGWAGDKCARAAWAKLSDCPIEDILAGKANRETGLKYMDFLADTTSRYPAEIFRIVRRHFPWARYGLPIGHHSEYPNGMNRALVVKRMCEVSTNLTVRWTSLGVFREFGKSNVFARRVESACRFYGCAFGEETSHPAVLADENLSSHAAYELVANEVTMLHNDYACMAQAGARNLARMRAFPRSPKVCDVALLWPDVGEKLYALRGAVVSDNRYTEAFVAKAGAFRQRSDYWICDTQMIRDGFLEKMGISRLVALEPIEPETEPVLAAFRARGGRVSDGSDFPPPPSPLVYRTVHRDFISMFTPSTGDISYQPRTCDSQSQAPCRKQ